MDTINPVVFLAQFFTFAWSYVLLCVVMISGSDIVSGLIIRVNYEQKNEFTRIPYMLELLRVTPTKTADQDYAITVANVFSLHADKDRLDKLPRSKAEAMYSHCCRWIQNLLVINPHALRTKITASKFYHTYDDIFQ